VIRTIFPRPDWHFAGEYVVEQESYAIHRCISVIQLRGYVICRMATRRISERALE
jgi:acetolactate synthase regulatory subunit